MEPYSTPFDEKEKKIITHVGVDISIVGIMAMKYQRFWYNKIVKRKDLMAKTAKTRRERKL